MKPRKIHSKRVLGEHDALVVADAVAQEGWRVVAITVDRDVWNVWFETETPMGWEPVHEVIDAARKQ